MSHCGLGLSCELVDEDDEAPQLLKDILRMASQINELVNRSHIFHEHKLRQIDENQKISKRIDGIEREIEKWIENDQSYSKNPHKCPLCDGKGYWHKTENAISCGGRCNTCEGKGIVWG